MEKTLATTALRRRHAHLTEMATRGTDHEKSIAKEKLARLESRHDFSKQSEPEAADIFFGWQAPTYSEESHPLFVVAKNWQDAANLVKWVLADQFQASSAWRTLPDGVSLLVHAKIADVERMKPFAKSLLETIIAACTEFTGRRDVRELDRAAFLNGLYDGLMDEARPAGGMMPGFSPVAKKKPVRLRKSKKSAPPVATSTSIHPYDLGRDAGRKLRTNMPREEICDAIRLAVGERTHSPA
jgi:hypothetical protein